MPDPFGKNGEVIHAYVNVAELPTDLPTDINPRMQNVESRVARQIATGLTDETTHFHLLNRGMTVVTKDAQYDNQTQKLKLSFGENNGVLDGGHTYAVLKQNPDPQAFIHLEILTGIKPSLIVDLARARNTSAQVHSESLANLEGHFDWIKESLKDEPFASKIAYKENEDSDAKPIDIREVVGLLTLFHPSFAPDAPPIIGYSSKARCLDLLANSEFQAEYEKLSPLVPDILKLYDFIHVKFASFYEEIGGFSGLDHPKKQSVKLGKVLEVKQFKQGFQLYYIDRPAFYRFPDGWLYPALAALRSLVEYRYVWKWRTDPFKFFEKHGKSLVSLTLESSKALGRNINAVGKSKPHWIQLYERVENTYLKAERQGLEQGLVA
jgi:hypothetical protein